MFMAMNGKVEALENGSRSAHDEDVLQLEKGRTLVQEGHWNTGHGNSRDTNRRAGEPERGSRLRGAGMAARREPGFALPAALIFSRILPIHRAGTLIVKILLVEDSRLIRMENERALGRAGYE